MSKPQCYCSLKEIRNGHDRKCPKFDPSLVIDRAEYNSPRWCRGLGALVALLALAGGFTTSNRCRAHEQRCELECNEDAPGGSLKRMRCYERCQARELVCNKEGDDEP